MSIKITPTCVEYNQSTNKCEINNTVCNYQGKEPRDGCSVRVGFASLLENIANGKMPLPDKQAHQ